MSLPQSILGPLTARAAIVPYPATVPGVTLYAKFNKFTLPRPSPSPSSIAGPQVALLLASGVGLASELWIPFIRRIYELQSVPGSPVRVLSVWTVDYANHGDAAALNERTLQDHYSEIFPTENKYHAVDAFLKSDLLTPQERANFVGVGHSGGGAGCFVSAMFDYPTYPFTSLVFVEPTFISRRAKPVFDEMVRRIKLVNEAKPTAWASTEDAMAYMTSRFPVKGFHPDVVSSMAATGFRPTSASERGDDPTKQVTTKTSLAQETASFFNAENIVNAWERLQTAMPALRMHVVLGTRQGFWPKPLGQDIVGGIERNRKEGKFASVERVEGAGHYVPQEKPYELAEAVFRILQLDASSGKYVTAARL